MNFVQLALRAKDPAYQEKRRLEEEAEQLRIEINDALCRAAIDLITEKIRSDEYGLSEKERDFLRSVRSQFSTKFYLSDPQQKWLFDLAGRHGHIFQSKPGAFAYRQEGKIFAVDGPGQQDVKQLASNEDFRAWAMERGVLPTEVDTALVLIHIASVATIEFEHSSPDQQRINPEPSQDNLKPTPGTARPQKMSLAERLAARNNRSTPPVSTMPARPRQRG